MVEISVLDLGLLLLAAGSVGVAGHLSGALWYTRRQFDRHKVMLFDPKEGAFSKAVAQIRADLPVVPTVSEIISQIPPYPDLTDKLALFEERMGAKLTATVDAKMASIEEQIAERVGRVVQANIASAKAAFKSGMTGLGEEMESEDGGVLGEILGTFMDSESVSKLGRIKRLYAKAKAAGGGKMDLGSLMGKRPGNGGAQGLPPVGTVQMDGQGRQWVFTGQMNATGGWALVNAAPPALATPPIPPPPAAPIDMPPPLPPEIPDGAKR